VSVPKRLQSVAEVVVDCRWWRIRHTRLPYQYNGTRYVTQYECTNPKLCPYNVSDERLGGCMIGGNVAKILVGEKP